GQDPRPCRRPARGYGGRDCRRSGGGSGRRAKGRMPGRRRVGDGRAGEEEHRGGTAPPPRDATHRGGRGYASLMIAAEWFFIVFRILHIGAGTVWVGSVFFLVAFVQPSAAAIAPAGAPFMSELLGARRLVDRILIIASVTIAAGLILYLRDMNDAGGFRDLPGADSGVALAVGGGAAVAGFPGGLFGTRPNVQRLLALGRQIASSEGPPSPDLTAKAQPLQDL